MMCGMLMVLGNMHVLCEARVWLVVSVLICVILSCTHVRAVLMIGWVVGYWSKGGRLRVALASYVKLMWPLLVRGVVYNC